MVHQLQKKTRQALRHSQSFNSRDPSYTVKQKKLRAKERSLPLPHYCHIFKNKKNVRYICVLQSHGSSIDSNGRRNLREIRLHGQALQAHSRVVGRTVVCSVAISIALLELHFSICGNGARISFCRAAILLIYGPHTDKKFQQHYLIFLHVQRAPRNNSNLLLSVAKKRQEKKHRAKMCTQNLGTETHSH